MDRTRFGNGLPKEMADSIDFNLKVDKASEGKRLEEWKKKLRAIKASGAAGRSREAYSRQPPHVGKVQGRFDFEFIIKVAEQLGLEEAGRPSFREYWEKGAPVNGSDNAEGGYFGKRKKHQWSAERKAESWLDHPIKLPTEPFSLMDERNLKRAWEDFKKRPGPGEEQLKEARKEEVGTCPTRPFGMEQGNYDVVGGLRIFSELRSCWDFREGLLNKTYSENLAENSFFLAFFCNRSAEFQSAVVSQSARLTLGLF